MPYRVIAVFEQGGAISIIVDDARSALAKVKHFRDEGAREILVKDLANELVSIADLIRYAAADYGAAP